MKPYQQKIGQRIVGMNGGKTVDDVKAMVGQPLDLQKPRLQPKFPVNHTIEQEDLVNSLRTVEKVTNQLPTDLQSIRDRRRNTDLGRVENQIEEEIK